jgi:glycosyltransferase involved in cell wall biosynthesis
MPIRVMYVVDHLKIGGAQTHLLELLSRLDRGRFFPMVCALKTDGELRGRLDAMGVPVHDGGLGATLKGWSGVHALWTLSRLLRRERVRVAHSYLFHPNILAPIAARVAGVPVVVVSKRSLDAYPNPLRRWAVKLGNALADRVTVNAEAVGRFVRSEERCRPRKMVLIPNGVSDEILDARADRAETRRRLNLPPDGPVVGVVSRLAWKKGVRYLLEAALRVLEAVPAATFLVAGDGPLRAELEAQSQAAGLGERVWFLGTRDDAVELFSVFDVFVLPSVIEGMSNALLEAMARGVPVVATQVGGNSEVVVDGETGFLVPAADPDRMATAITKLLQAPELAHEMGAAGKRRIVEHYGIDVMVRRIEALYEGLLAGRSR